MNDEWTNGKVRKMNLVLGERNRLVIGVQNEQRKDVELPVLLIL